MCGNNAAIIKNKVIILVRVLTAQHHAVSGVTKGLMVVAGEKTHAIIKQQSVPAPNWRTQRLLMQAPGTDRFYESLLGANELLASRQLVLLVPLTTGNGHVRSSCSYRLVHTHKCCGQITYTNVMDKTGSQGLKKSSINDRDP